MNRKIFFIMLAAYFSLMVSESHAGWLIYHKPEYKGRVIDAETKEPIEGAVVAVYYMKDNLGGVSYIIHTKEALTDQNGEFVIPSYTTLIAPYSIEYDAKFIIYKPGYAPYPSMTLIKSDAELFFLEEKAGEKGLSRWTGKEIQFTYGILELPPLKTARQRIDAIPSRPTGECRSKEFPLLYKLINEEHRRFGMEDER
jgi:hypothetical protein